MIDPQMLREMKEMGLLDSEESERKVHIPGIIKKAAQIKKKKRKIIQKSKRKNR